MSHRTKWVKHQLNPPVYWVARLTPTIEGKIVKKSKQYFLYLNGEFIGHYIYINNAKEKAMVICGLRTEDD